MFAFSFAFRASQTKFCISVDPFIFGKPQRNIKNNIKTSPRKTTQPSKLTLVTVSAIFHQGSQNSPALHFICNVDFFTNSSEIDDANVSYFKHHSWSTSILSLSINSLQQLFVVGTLEGFSIAARLEFSTKDFVNLVKKLQRLQSALGTKVTFAPTVWLHWEGKF